jgi:ankyrin repeat protein
MPPKRKAQVSVVELQQGYCHGEKSNNKFARNTNGNEQQQPGLNLDCPQDEDPIITQFKPVKGQWELNDENINRIDPKTGHTILHNYCQHINSTPFEVYRYLIEVKGCRVNARDDSNDTPLHRALRYFDPNAGGDITVLHYLLSQEGLNGDHKGKYGYTLLHLACINIKKLPLDIFKLLIEKGGCDVNEQDNSNDTPLHDALRYFDRNEGGNINVLTYLLSQENVMSISRVTVVKLYFIWLVEG